MQKSNWLFLTGGILIGIVLTVVVGALSMMGCPGMMGGMCRMMPMMNCPGMNQS